MSDQIKQFIVVRKDLGMRRGKEDAQSGHGALSFIAHRIREKLLPVIEMARSSPKTDVTISLRQAEVLWFLDDFTKIALVANTEEQLRDLYQQAKDAGLESHLILDSGKTEFHGEPTYTVLCIGPDYADKIAPITGHLDLR